MYVEEAQLGARADGVEGARGSRHWYRIDHAEAHLRWRLAWEEPGQAPGWLPAGSPLVGLPPKVETGARALTALWCSVATTVWTATSAHTVAVSQ